MCFNYASIKIGKYIYRKWINFCYDINAVLFVVNIASYNETIFEAYTNGIVESLNCFNEQINKECFQDIGFQFFLIFNKVDVFEQKIKKVPITVAPCFKDFNGNPNDCESVKELIVQTFIDQRKVYTLLIYIFAHYNVYLYEYRIVIQISIQNL